MSIAPERNPEINPTTDELNAIVGTQEKDTLPWWKKRATKIGATVVGIALVGGIAAGFGAANVNANNNQPGVEAPANPGRGETSTAPGEAVQPAVIEAFEAYVSDDARIAERQLPAEMSDQELPGKFASVLDRWINEGANDEFLEINNAQQGNTREDTARYIVAKWKPVYATALFGPDWESNAQVVDFVDKMAESHQIGLNGYIKTAWNIENPLIKEPYHVSIDGEGSAQTIGGQEGETTRSVTLHYTSNADKVSEATSPGSRYATVDVSWTGDSGVFIGTSAEFNWND